MGNDFVRQGYMTLFVGAKSSKALSSTPSSKGHKALCKAGNSSDINGSSGDIKEEVKPLVSPQWWMCPKGRQELYYYSEGDGGPQYGYDSRKSLRLVCDRMLARPGRFDVRSRWASGYAKSERVYSDVASI